VTSYLLAGVNINAHPVPVLAISGGGLVSAVCLVLIFVLPPRTCAGSTRARRAHVGDGVAMPDPQPRSRLQR
jgi:hypothetical protein